MKAFEDGPTGAAPRRRRQRRLSEVFAQLARDAEGPVTLGRIIEGMGTRAFAPLLVLFAAINLVPLPPPSSAILGLPLLAIACQMAYGNRKTWLPSFLMQRSVTAEQFRFMMDWVIPKLRRVEDFIRPRYWPFWRRQGDRVVGVIAVVLAISVVLPIPGGNWLPAFSSALLGLAALERDGILFAVGGAVGVIAMAWVATIVAGAGMAAHWAAGYMPGFLY